MHPLTLFALSLSLSTDAFAAALARTGRNRKVSLASAIRVGAVFGIAEGMMFLAGWGLGQGFAALVERFDHWLALVLLTVIGARMIKEGREKTEAPAGKLPSAAPTRTVRAMLPTAIATSIDSAAVGAALALAGIGAQAALVIGATSFTASTCAALVGPWVGQRLGQRAEILGGGVLIALGVVIFLSDTTGG